MQQDRGGPSQKRSGGDGAVPAGPGYGRPGPFGHPSDIRTGHPASALSGARGDPGDSFGSGTGSCGGQQQLRRRVQPQLYPPASSAGDERGQYPGGGASGADRRAGGRPHGLSGTGVWQALHRKCTAAPGRASAAGAGRSPDAPGGTPGTAAADAGRGGRTEGSVGGPSGTGGRPV